MSLSSSNKALLALPRSKQYRGPFGRLFRGLHAWRSPHSDEVTAIKALKIFATNSMSEQAGANANLDNKKIPAGYTYFGQFVDHDITFDPTSSLMRQNDPDSLENFRTPRLDLDCLYGEGPDDEPFMYDKNQGGTFLLGVTSHDWKGLPINGSSNEPDLPRNVQGTAIIGDKRNDENVVVSQFQLSMLRLHNRVMRSIVMGDPDSTKPFPFDGEAFHEAQQKVRWFYQYVVWNDYIRRLVSDEIWQRVLNQNNTLEFNGTVYNWKHQPFMPVEFSVAAYRFGHSMIRPGYQVNTMNDSATDLGFGVEHPIFHPDGAKDRNGNVIRHDLHGFRHFPHRHTVQWDWYFDINSSGSFPQPSRRIDPMLSSAVFRLDEGPDPKPNMLAFLNILRSMKLGLPTGTDVAHQMGLVPHGISDPHEDILWFYILKEAQNLQGTNSGRMLGRVGGRIVAEVFGGLLSGDAMSYVSMRPLWKPAHDADLMACLAANGSKFDQKAPFNGGDWEVGDLLRAAGAPINDSHVNNTINNGSN